MNQNLMSIVGIVVILAIAFALSSNRRAIRAYEKAGFRTFDTRTSIYGPALMMARDAED